MQLEKERWNRDSLSMIVGVRCSQGWDGEAAEAKTIFNGAIKDTLEKAEALEKHVKTVTMRAEPLATTEAEFFKTLLDRQGEAQKHLNELSAQLGQQNSILRSTQ